MNRFEIDFDDATYSYRLVNKYAVRCTDIQFLRDTTCPSIEYNLEAMKNAAYVVGMRYHSVVFANEIGCPFSAIDYTAGGKIRSYLASKGKLDCVVEISAITEMATDNV